ncbi:MAG: hypothetical protein EHM48_08045, partial [Planctomycetaceae bacterium]
MTRETRIGLLVGLVFIVMFGIVLADMTNTGKTTTAEPTVATPEGGTNVLPVIPVTETPTSPIIAIGSEPLAGDTRTPSPTEDARLARLGTGETVRIEEHGSDIPPVVIEPGYTTPVAPPVRETVRPPV